MMPRPTDTVPAAGNPYIPIVRLYSFAAAACYYTEHQSNPPNNNNNNNTTTTTTKEVTGGDSDSALSKSLSCQGPDLGLILSLVTPDF